MLSSPDSPDAGSEKTTRSRGKALRFGIGLALPVLAGVVYFLAKTLTEPDGAARAPERFVTLNPAAKSRILQVPFSDVGVPGMSPGGDWISFPAADARDKWDVYVMSDSAGEPRKVSSDSSTNISGTDVSPDGRMIVYDRWNPHAREYEVCVVPADGGTGRKIAEPGMVPRWRPDGRRIGYMVNTAPFDNAPGRLEFRSVRPDGSDPLVELDEPDVPATGPCSFAWSPDGRSIAFVRTFPEGYQELFINGFESGKRVQLTFDRQSIRDVCWTRDDNIIYSSGRGGSANLWIMPSGGGTPVQVTGGNGPDINMKISEDGKKLISLQRRRIGHIWLADSTGVVTGQISTGEYDVRSASMSPDGKKVAFEAFEPDPMNPVSHIYLVSRDAGDTHVLTSGKELARAPRWSPDGKWISYCARLTAEPADSERAYIVDPLGSVSPRSLGRAHDAWWFDSTRLILQSATQSWLMSTLGGVTGTFYRDSALAIPISAGGAVLFQDLRRGGEGWWIDSLPRWDSVKIPPGTAHSIAAATPSLWDSLKTHSDSITRPAGGAAPSGDLSRVHPDPAAAPTAGAPRSTDLLSGRRDSVPARAGTVPNARFVLRAGVQFALYPADGYILYRKGDVEIWKLSLVDGTERQLPGRFPGHGIGMSVSFNGKEILFVDSRNSSTLVLTENLR